MLTRTFSSTPPWTEEHEGEYEERTAVTSQKIRKKKSPSWCNSSVILISQPCASRRFRGGRARGKCSSFARYYIIISRSIDRYCFLNRSSLCLFLRPSIYFFSSPPIIFPPQLNFPPVEIIRRRRSFGFNSGKIRKGSACIRRNEYSFVLCARF